MRILRAVITWMLIVGLCSPAFADDLGERPADEAAATRLNAASVSVGGLRESIARVAEQAAQPEAGPMPRGYLWAGTAMFVGGMAAGVYGFLNNQNGSFPGFGEAEATDKKLGTAGLALAFAGGTILFLGSQRASRAPSVTFGPGRVAVSQRLSW